MPVTGVVLAAGRSERMGRPKALLEFQGRSFLETVLGTMSAAGVASRLVVVGESAADIQTTVVQTGARVVVSEGGEHQIDSVRVALRAAPDADAALIWPVDHPLVQVDTVRALLRSFKGAGTPIVAPSFDHRRGHPVVWARETWGALLDHPAGQKEGARAVARLFPVLHVETSDAAVVDDIDTPEQYARLLSRGRAGKK